MSLQVFADLAVEVNQVRAVTLNARTGLDARSSQGGKVVFADSTGLSVSAEAAQKLIDFFAPSKGTPSDPVVSPPATPAQRSQTSAAE